MASNVRESHVALVPECPMMSHVVQGAKNSVNQTTQATCAKDWRAEITYLTWCADEALMVHYRRSHPRPDPDKMSIL